MRARIVSVAAAVAIILALSSCSGKKAERTLFAMDTVMQVTVYGKDASQAADLSVNEINRLDRLFSAWDGESDVSAVNGGGTVSVSDDTVSIVRQAEAISELTDGAFDITVRPLVRLWGFENEAPSVPDESDIRSALNRVGYAGVTVGDNTVSARDGGIDLGGIAKGYACSKIRSILTQSGTESAMIYLGGNVMLMGQRPDGRKWNVGIQHPCDSAQLIGAVTATDVSVVTSGGYQRCFEQDGNTYHHILDPKTGYPADSGIISATVITADDTSADALSTALYVMGVDKAEKLIRDTHICEAVLVTADTVYITPGLKDCFELKDDSYAFVVME